MFLEGHHESAKESTQNNQLLTVAPWMAQFLSPAAFATSPDNFIQQEVETPAPSSLYPVHDLHILDISEAPLPPISQVNSRCAPSGTQQNHSHSPSISPKTKKLTISPFKWPPRLIACDFCQSRKIVCGLPLLGSSD